MGFTINDELFFEGYDLKQTGCFATFHAILKQEPTDPLEDGTKQYTLSGRLCIYLSQTATAKISVADVSTTVTDADLGANKAITLLYTAAKALYSSTVDVL